MARPGAFGIAARIAVRGDQLTADEISPTLEKAIVAIEDRRCYEHGARRPRHPARGLPRRLAWPGARGRQPLTQQLARLTLLSPERAAAASGATASWGIDFG